MVEKVRRCENIFEMNDLFHHLIPIFLALFRVRTLFNERKVFDVDFASIYFFFIWLIYYGKIVSNSTTSRFQFCDDFCFQLKIIFSFCCRLSNKMM